jgi:hypothetical protein
MSPEWGARYLSGNVRRHRQLGSQPRRHTHDPGDRDRRLLEPKHVPGHKGEARAGEERSAADGDPARSGGPHRLVLREEPNPVQARVGEIERVIQRHGLDGRARRLEFVAVASVAEADDPEPLREGAVGAREAGRQADHATSRTEHSGAGLPS